jgi:hypothetical protein
MSMLRFVRFALSVTVIAAACASAQANEHELQQQIAQLFAKKDYAAAADVCRKQVEANPKSNDGYYNLACALARMGKKDDALDSLAKSIDNGYADAGHMKEDDDLATLHDEKRFIELAEKAGAAQKNADYEHGGEIPGTKIVENFPDGGLRYRIRMNPDESAKPSRLIVWLHPSGGSMNNVIESLSPMFVKHGFALLVVTRKQWMGWTGPEGDQLLNKTLPDVAKIKGIDARRPILMGFSAGGQAALQMWESNPGAFGGLVLDAAYPLDMEKYMHGQRVVMTLPKNEKIKETPIFTIVGEKDGGSEIWKKCEADWRTAGIPLTTRYVPNGVHQWLFGKSQLPDLESWLAQIAEGKLPKDEPAAAVAK